MRNLLTLLLVIPLLLSAQTIAEQILAKTVSYHDPQGNWPTLEATFYFKETRPPGQTGRQL